MFAERFCAPIHAGLVANLILEQLKRNASPAYRKHAEAQEAHDLTPAEEAEILADIESDPFRNDIHNQSAFDCRNNIRHLVSVHSTFDMAPLQKKSMTT